MSSVVLPGWRSSIRTVLAALGHSNEGHYTVRNELNRRESVVGAGHSRYCCDTGPWRFLAHYHLRAPLVAKERPSRVLRRPGLACSSLMTQRCPDGLGLQSRPSPCGQSGTIFELCIDDFLLLNATMRLADTLCKCRTNSRRFARHAPYIPELHQSFTVSPSLQKPYTSGASTPSAYTGH